MSIIGWICTIGSILFVLVMGILYLYARGFGGK